MMVDSNTKPKNKVGEKGHDTVITTHVNADFDALASMLAAKKLYPEATLVFPGSQEKNLRNFFLHSTSYIFDFSKVKQIDFNNIRKLILVDTRQKSRIGKFAELINNKDIEIHIYDHHPDSDEDIKGSFEVIQKVGANTSIMTNMIREKGIPLTPDEATILCLGIHEDTGSFTFSSTQPEDYRAAAWLTEQGANHNIISDMLTRELTTEQIGLLNDMTQSAATHIINNAEVVVTKIIRENYIGDFAVLVHKFMDMENLNVLFALAQMEDKIYLVARSRTEDVNVAEIALTFKGGGHPQAASATIKNKTLAQVEKTLLELLSSRIIPEKKAKDMMTSPVISISPADTIEKAANTMTKYNINVLVVLNEQQNLNGYITRQVTEKAIYFGLGHIQVKDYMNIEFFTVGPETPLREVQDLIIENRLRILPVMEQDHIVGVITRTDLMNILVGGPVIPDFYYDTRHVRHFLRNKNFLNLLKECLPEDIFRILKECGEVADRLGYNAYLVGGLVRDILLKRENLDVDVVVEGDGIHFAHEYARDKQVRVRSHKKFGTAVLIFPDGFKIDVATARVEYYESPAAPPVVEISSLKMDLFRRDFTVNTLAIRLNKKDFGTLIDHFGGQQDLKEKVIRVLHNLSFIEDPTRIIRAIRFEQRFGFTIGKLTLALIKNAIRIECFKNLSGRRLFLELKLLLMEENAKKAIERMDEFDLLTVISPKLSLTKPLMDLLDEIEKVITWFKLLYIEASLEPWKVYWYGLTAMLDTQTLAQVAQNLQMADLESRRMIDQEQDINHLLNRLHQIKHNDFYEIYTLLSQYDTEILLFLMARTNNERLKRQISFYFTKLKGEKINFKGRDLIKMGFKPGPLYREILDNLLKARLNEQLTTKEDEEKFVLENYGKYLENRT